MTITIEKREPTELQKFFMKTDTPETDSMMSYCFGTDDEFVRKDFARNLERERDHFKNLVGLATAYVFEDGKQKGIREVVTERDESRALCAQMSQEREHNAMQALMWRSVAEGLAGHVIRELHYRGCDCCSCQNGREALKAFEEAKG